MYETSYMPGIVPRNLHKSTNLILLIILEFDRVSPPYRWRNGNLGRLRFTWDPRGRERQSGSTGSRRLPR